MSVHRDERNSKKWLVSYRGHKKRGFNSKREALLYESKLKFEGTLDYCNLYFYDLADKYLLDLEHNSSYATFSKAKQIFRDYIKPNFPNKRISSVKELDCKSFRDSIQSLSLSTRTKNYILDKFKAVFKFATLYYHSSNSSYIVLQPFKSSFSELQKKNDKTCSVWSLDEFSKFIVHVHNYKYKLFFTTLFFTGMRLGEALALTWNDFKGDTLTISKSLSKWSKNGSYEIKEPKTLSSIRDVSLNSSLISSLNSYKVSQSKIKGFSNDWFIFGNIYPLARSTVSRYLDRGIKDSGVKRITIHSFRHSHASNLISNGVNIVAVSKRLGHSDVNMTLKVYTHLMPKNDKELLNYLENSSQNLPT